MSWTTVIGAYRLCVVFLWLLTLPAAARAHGPLSARIDAVSRQIAAAPSNASLYVERAELYRREGRLDHAARDLDHADRLDPGSAPVQIARATLALDAGRGSEARSLLDGVLAEDPDLTPALLLRAEVFEAIGLADEAAIDLDRVIAASTRPAPEWYADRARLLIGLGEPNWDRAVAGLDEGLHRLGPVPALAEMAVDLEVRRGRFDAALARIDSIGLSSPGSATWKARRGDILHRAGRPVEAWVAWSEALARLENLPASRRHAPSTAALESRLRAALSPGGPQR